VPLFWRLFIPNACVLAAACLILIIEPANGRIPALVGGLTVMLAVNLVLMRRATDPLTRLIGVMRDARPLVELAAGRAARRAGALARGRGGAAGGRAPARAQPAAGGA
jgi:hypothetical protein